MSGAGATRQAAGPSRLEIAAAVAATAGILAFRLLTADIQFNWDEELYFQVSKSWD